MKRAIISLALVIMVISPAWGQQVLRLTVVPAKAPVPAMKYTLLPELRDLEPGNAALLYQRAHTPEYLDPFRRHPDYGKNFDWLELPLEKFPADKVRRILPVKALREVDLGARREQCDWDLTRRLRKEGFGLLLGDLLVFREFSYLLAVRCRLEMLEKRWDRAVYTLQTGLGLSRHVADSPSGIGSLVGMALGLVMLERIEELIQQEGAPNLYWALTDLPRPFIDLRKLLQAEKIMVDTLFPGIREALRNPRLPPLSAEKFQEGLNQLGAIMVSGKIKERLAADLAAARIHPQAKKFLIGQGFTKAQVEALPVIQVALMYGLALYDHHYDNMYKWAGLPYWEARPRLKQVEKELCDLKRRAQVLKSGGIPLAEFLIPDLSRVVFARARVERRLDALRCLEAIRLYAAGPTGRLPASLRDIKEVPIPVDPVTGKDFEYKVTEGKAVLVGPPPVGEPATEANSFRYELSLRAGAGSKSEK